MIRADLVPFWTVVAQVVPVFSIALVLESRQASTRWTASHRAARVIQGAALGLAAILMFALELTALVGAATDLRLGWAVVPALIATAIIIAGLAVGPVASVAARGAVDIFMIVGDIMPWSAWRRERRSLRRLEVVTIATIKSKERLRDLSREALTTIAGIGSKLERQRAANLKSDIDPEAFRQIFEGGPRDIRGGPSDPNQILEIYRDHVTMLEAAASNADRDREEAQGQLEKLHEVQQATSLLSPGRTAALLTASLSDLRDKAGRRALQAEADAQDALIRSWVDSLSVRLEPRSVAED